MTKAESEKCHENLRGALALSTHRGDINMSIKRKASPRNVIQFPGGTDYNFKSYRFRPNEITKAYDQQRSLVVIVQGILGKDASTLKQTVLRMAAASEKFSPTDLIDELNEAAGAFKALGELFSCAAARLTVVDRKLV
jgi:hypothetical protein